MPPEILFTSNHIIIINKPAGLPVHPGPRGGPSVEDFFPLWRRGHDGPWLAHRLDADTAGCLVIARRKSTLIKLQAAFADGSVSKIYWAVVRGEPAESEGIVDLPLEKHNAREGWRMAPDARGKSAQTIWRCLAAHAGQAWLELKPLTGRTHQIRAHCAAIGHPILGDSTYGGGSPPLMLMARQITLPLEPPITATAPVPAHLQAALQCFAGGLIRLRQDSR